MPNVAHDHHRVPEPLRVRLPVDFPVTLEVAARGSREVGTVANLSARGIFAASRLLLPVGTGVKATFYLPLPDGPRAVVASSRVRWINDPSAPSTADLPGGMGLEFVGLHGASRADLERFIATLLAAPAGR